MNLQAAEYERESNPVDMVEHVACINDWSFNRNGEDEISIEVAGDWTGYMISFSWMEEYEALLLASAFDITIPKERAQEATRLLSMVNEQLLAGHFDLSQSEGWVMYRQTLMLNGGAEPTGQQLEALLANGLEACERYYQAFQLVMWAGYDARQALESALFETVGNA